MLHHHGHDGAGPTIILLHGSGLTGQVWHRWLDGFEERKCIAPDLGGYGRSPRLDQPASKDWRDDLSAIERIADSQDGPIDVIGQSYGGFLALQLALARPDLVRRLALHEPVLWGALNSGGSPEHIAAFAEVVHTLSSVEPGGIPWLEGFVDFWGGEGSWAGMGRARQRGWRVLGPIIAAEVMALTYEPTPHTAYASVGAETLLTWGTGTATFQRGVMDLLGRWMPRARVVEVPGGHMGPFNNPDTVLPLHRSHLGA
jgi:pimeloyl-ACP methyl ester carboxylesterase